MLSSQAVPKFWNLNKIYIGATWVKLLSIFVVSKCLAYLICSYFSTKSNRLLSSFLIRFLVIPYGCALVFAPFGPDQTVWWLPGHLQTLTLQRQWAWWKVSVNTHQYAPRNSPDRKDAPATLLAIYDAGQQCEAPLQYAGRSHNVRVFLNCLFRERAGIILDLFGEKEWRYGARIRVSIGSYLRWIRVSRCNLYLTNVSRLICGPAETTLSNIWPTFSGKFPLDTIVDQSNFSVRH